jgi:membrane protein
MLSGVARARTLGLAAEMSFWLFLSLVPLAAVAGWLAARVATSQARVAPSLLASVPSEARELMERQVHRVAAWHGATIAPLAAGTFLWLAASGVHAVFEALEVQSGTSRPWWKKRALALATCLTLAIGGALVALLAVGLGWVQRLAESAAPDASTQLARGPIVDAVRWTTAALLAVAMTAGLYRVGIPRDRRDHGPILPGALLSVVLQALLGWGYGFYLSKLGGGSAYQAGLAVVGVTLTTLWLFSIALLLGANLNAAVAASRRPAPGGAPAEGAEVASHLRYRDVWPSSDASSSRPTSPRPPTAPSTGPSTSPPASAPRSSR